MFILSVIGCVTSEYDAMYGMQVAEYIGCEEGHRLGLQAADAAFDSGQEVGDPWSWIPPDDLDGIAACVGRSGAESYQRSVEDDCSTNAKLGALECYAPAYIGRWYSRRCE